MAISAFAGASSPAALAVEASADGHWVVITAVPKATRRVRRAAFL
jgi:hypothetical protein